MYRHVPPLSRVLLVCKQLVHKVGEREPPLRKDALLAVLAEDDVLLVEHRRRPDTKCLLARRDHVEADSALALGVKHDEVHDGYAQHGLVELDNFLLADVGDKGLVDDAAVLVDDAVCRHRGTLGAQVELEAVGKGALDGARK